MTNASDPMFPTIQQTNPNSFDTVLGLTIREHFAAMAMQGIYAGSSNALSIRFNDRVTIALDAVTAADALIKALNQTL
jgi:hypothetical protein